MTSLRGLNQFWVLLLEQREVALRVPVPDTIGREQKVHFFECALVGFWVQCPHHGDRDHVTSCKDVISFFVEGLEHDGAEQSEPTIADGPTNDTPCVAFGTNFKWEDFGWVQPRDREPGGAKSSSEKEDHSHSTGAVAARRRATLHLVETQAREAAGKEHGNTLHDGAPVESPAAANTVESEDANEGGKLYRSVIFSK